MATSRLARAGRWLAALLNVRSGEHQVVALLLVHSLFVGFARVFSVTASEPLFLVQWGADKLPYLYIGSALATAAAGAAYTRVAARLSFVTLLVVNLSMLLTVTGAFRLLLTVGGSRSIVLALAIWSFVLGVLLNLEFWSLAGHLMDVRQAKRLFGLIGTGEVVATIAGGLITPLLVRAIGTANLLLVAAAAIAGALGCLIAVSRMSPERVVGHEPPVEEQPRTSTPGLLRQPYVVLMFMYTSVSWLVYYLIDNAFYQQAATRFADDARLASFLGIFLAGAGLLTLVARTLVSGRIITRFGLTAGLLALPVLDAIGAGTLALAGMVAGTGALVFFLATMTKLIDKVIGNSIYQTSFLTLYQPLPGPLRIRAQTVTESFVEPAAGACAGLVLLILLNRLSFGAVELSSVAFAILVGLIVVARRLGREYPAALMRALSRRGLDAGSLTLDDPASVNVLLASARSPGVGAVLYALDLLESIEHAALPSALSDALAHPVPEVRQDVLGRIERLGLVTLLPDVRERLRLDPVVAVRGACLRTLATLLPGGEAAQIAVHLDDAEPEVRAGAVVGLLSRPDHAGDTRAHEVLDDLATSAKPEERALAARTIGTIGRPELAGMLHELLGDGALVVRNAGLVAAGTLRQPELWPRLIHALVPPTTSAAAMGLVAGGDAALPMLRAIFDDPASPRSLLVHLARVCGRIGTPDAQQLLLSQLHVPDGEVRKEVLVALRHCGWRAQNEAQDQVLARINAEIADAAWLAAVLDDTGAGSARLLRDAVRHQLQQTRERLLLLLSLIYDPETIRRVRMHLRASSPEKRAYATELLDVTIEYAWRARILPVFEDVPDQERARRLGAWFPQPRLAFTERLQQLAAAGDGDQHPWMRACVLYALHPGDMNMRSIIEKVLALKEVSLFTGTPDEVLLEVTAILDEMEVDAGRMLFAKGDIGTCMYIVVDGRVRVHDGDHTLDELGPGEFFGEMALLDIVPRVASVTVVEPATLFRLDQDSLYELMDDRPEIARSIIRVLSARLRARVEDVTELNVRVRELGPEPPAPAHGSSVMDPARTPS